MAGASRSLTRSYLSTSRYFCRAIQGRIEALGGSSSLSHGLNSPSSSSPPDCDVESSSWAWKSVRPASPVARVSEDVTCKQSLLQLHKETCFTSSRPLILQPRANVRQYGGIAFDDSRCSELAWTHRGFLRSPPSRSPFVTGGIRYKTKYSKSEKAAKRDSKKKKAKAIRLKLRQIRLARKLRKASMTPEQTFLYRIEKCKKKIGLHEQQLKKYELPPLPEPDPDPEVLTEEQLYALKKLGYKNKNYVPVGRRGIYGGTIQNMHMHWKKHETVRIDCDNFPKEKIKDMGEQLERLSGGTVIDIHQGTTIIMWRGRNYKRPKTDIPIMFKNFNKRKALLKSKHEQSIGSLKDQIAKWEKDLRQVRADMARERVRWLEENPGKAPPEPALSSPVATDESDYDSDMTDTDDDITAVEDLGPEYDSESDYEYPDSDLDHSDDGEDGDDGVLSSDIDSDDEWEDDSYISGGEGESESDFDTPAHKIGVRAKQNQASMQSHARRVKEDEVETANRGSHAFRRRF